jgi:hypothetical protein
VRTGQVARFRLVIPAARPARSSLSSNPASTIAA